jgi:hypothetical protein
MLTGHVDGQMMWARLRLPARKPAGRKGTGGSRVKPIILCAGSALLLGVCSCNNSVNFNGTVAVSTSYADLRPAPDVSSSQLYQLHSSIPIAGGTSPVATSQQYMLVLGSVANDTSN